MLRRIGFGADEAEDPVGVIGVAGPDLRAVDEPVVALVFGLGLQPGEVGSRARLRVALAPADLAPDDRRNELLLLLFVRELQERRAEHPEAEAVQRRARADPAELLLGTLFSSASRPPPP